MKRITIIASLFGVLLLTTAAIAGAAAPSKLLTFGTGEVTIGTVGGASAIITNGVGEYGGVYVQAKSQGSKTLGNVTFQFTSRGDVAGGAPRFSLPINDGAFDPNTDYAFIDAAGCGAVSNVERLVSTQNPACHVNFHGTDYANWTAFASANPTYKMASGYVPFIIADGTAGTYNVTDIVLR
jgi:hypothetical protein